MCGWHQGVLLQSLLHIQVNGPVHGTLLKYSTLGSPVTLCRAQRRVVCCLVGAPLVVVAVLVATLVIRAATIQDRFQLRTLADDDISFISPSEEQVNGELLYTYINKNRS